jgi:hypothetical protein
MSDYEPLSSEEMIRRAREEMAKTPPPSTRLDPELEDERAEVIEREEPEPVSRSSSYRPSRQGPVAMPTDPYADRRRARRASGSKTASIAVMMALVILGAAIALAVLASSATP